LPAGSFFVTVNLAEQGDGFRKGLNPSYGLREHRRTRSVEAGSSRFADIGKSLPL